MTSVAEPRVAHNATPVRFRSTSAAQAAQPPCPPSCLAASAKGQFARHPAILHTTPAGRELIPGVVFGPDLAAVNWHGTVYTFTPKQRLVVAALVEARRDGYAWLSQQHLMLAAESVNGSGRLRVLFRGNPAWGVVVVKAKVAGQPAGAYRLGTE